MKDLKRKSGEKTAWVEPVKVDIAADPVVRYMSMEALEKAAAKARKAMEKAASALDFIEAAGYRDEMLAYQELIEKKKRP